VAEVGAHPNALQLTLFGSLYTDTVDELKDLDVNPLTSLDALAALQRLQEDILKREGQGG